MFGHRRKQEEDNLGLSAPIVSPAASSTAAVSASPSPPPPTPPFPWMAEGATPGSGPAMLAQILAARGPIGELISQIKADPQGFRERVMQQAQAAGVSTYVMTPQGMALTGGGAAPPQQVDVVEELTKAAALHDKGVLTDAEFEVLKKKLLAE
jgi:hypothetical protein